MTRAQAPRLVYLEEGAKERMLTSLSPLGGCEVQNTPIAETRKLSSNKLDRPSSDKMEPMTEVRRSKGESSLFIEWQLCVEWGGGGGISGQMVAWVMLSLTQRICFLSYSPGEN